MSYPLLCPTGTPLGWTTTLEHSENYQSAARKRTKVKLIQFYSHQLMRRENKSILPHAGGRLFQQYCVDAYCKAEGQRLIWVRQNQDTLRAEEYEALKDWAQSQQAAAAGASSSDGSSTAHKFGRAVILPSSFGGGTRAMQMNYQDAMAIVRQHGMPD